MKVALAPYLGDEDIVIGSINEIVDANCPLPSIAKNILSKASSRAVVAMSRLAGKSDSEAKNIALKRYYQKFIGLNPPHPPAERAAKFAGDCWGKYKKFCFVRNPYEQVVSDYIWRLRATRKDFSFSHFLGLLEDRDDSSGVIHPYGLRNWDLIAIDGNIAVDYVGRYENIVSDFSGIMRDIGIDNIHLNAKQKIGKYRQPMSDFYGVGDRRRVERIFSEEIENFNYSWPF